MTLEQLFSINQTIKSCPRCGRIYTSTPETIQKRCVCGYIVKFSHNGNKEYYKLQAYDRMMRMEPRG